MDKQPSLHRLFFSALFLVFAFSASCQRQSQPQKAGTQEPVSTVKPFPATVCPQLRQLVESAIEQTKITTGYDPSYVRINYPGGDVPIETGVCSDVVVRGFRKAGVDLQKEIHDDMGRAWPDYPKKWGANGRDPNIDHRRVWNLMTYFKRQGKSLPVTTSREDYQPGDIVTWDLGNGADHIGIVVNSWSENRNAYLMVHNIGAGARVEDVLFSWRITGHYRYF